MEDSNKNDNNQDECCNYRCILSIIFLIFIISMIKHYFSNFFFLPEDNFLKAINKSWKKHPIMNISLEQKEGFEKMTFMNWNLDKDICDCLYIDDYEDEYEGKCSETLIEDGCNEYNKNNNSTKLYNTTLYVKYYKEDYLSLFKRIRNDKERGKLCKKGYRKCGYLDSLNNPFYRNEGESCPINEIKFFYDNGKIKKIETHNESKNLPVFNQLIVSGIYNATILDTGKFFSLNNINNLERIREPDEIFYSLKLVRNIKYIKSYDFFLENNLIKGKIQKNYKIKNLYLFYSIYTGNKIDNSIISKNILYTFIINRITRSILKIIILLLIIISILVCCNYRPNNKKGLKKYIIIIVIDIFFLLINVYHYKVKKEVYNIFNDYNNKYELDDFYDPLIFEIIFLFFEFVGIIIFIIKVIIYCYHNYSNSNIKEEYSKINEGILLELQNNLYDNKIKESKNENTNEKILIEHDSCINESGEKQKEEKIKQVNNNENEETIAIKIETLDQNKSRLYACKENDQFKIYRDKFLNEFQDYKSKNIYFISNGNKIDENKTLKENKIKDSSVIELMINIIGD